MTSDVFEDVGMVEGLLVSACDDELAADWWWETFEEFTADWGDMGVRDRWCMSSFLDYGNR